MLKGVLISRETLAVGRALDAQKASDMQRAPDSWEGP